MIFIASFTNAFTLLNRLDAEILSFKQQYHSSLWFFEKSRKDTMIDHIMALQQLKYAIEVNSSKDVKTIIANLDSKAKALLKKYEPDLLKDLIQTPLKPTGQAPSR